MHHFIVDANVFQAYFSESVCNRPIIERTGSAVPIFDALGTDAIVFFDEQRQIISEWAALTRGAEEWFGEWLASGFASGKMYEIKHSKDAQIQQRYCSLGFPNGKDIWYIKVALGLVVICNRTRPRIVAEDIDFYEPKLKKAKNKKAIFIKEKGAVADRLKKEGVDVSCIASVSNLLENANS